MKLYRHYKQKFYKYLGEARHSETEDTLVVYDCLYPNPSGQTWVRPKSMFHEMIEHGGRKRPRFEAVELEINETENLDEAALNDLASLMIETFGSFDREDFHSTIKAHPARHHLVRAAIDGRPVGFRFGFQKDSTTFQAWLGAVHPDFRGLGIGQQMLQTRDNWCRRHGFTVVQTSTPAHSRQMLIHNLKNGFAIHATTTSSQGLQILMQKNL